MSAGAGLPRIGVRGKVYFVQSGDRPFIKIGWTLDPQARLAQLQCGNPDTLKLLGTVTGTVEDERGWHARFKHLSVRNEWFHLNDEMREAIADRRKVAREVLADRHPGIGIVGRTDMVRHILALRAKDIRNEAYPRGSASASSRLDEAKVTAILMDRRSVRAVAKEYGVGAMTIQNIRARKTWRHVPDPRLNGSEAA